MQSAIGVESCAACWWQQNAGGCSTLRILREHCCHEHWHNAATPGSIACKPYASNGVESGASKAAIGAMAAIRNTVLGAYSWTGYL